MKLKNSVCKWLSSGRRTFRKSWPWSTSTTFTWWKRNWRNLKRGSRIWRRSWEICQQMWNANFPRTSGNFWIRWTRRRRSSRRYSASKLTTTLRNSNKLPSSNTTSTTWLTMSILSGIKTWNGSSKWHRRLLTIRRLFIRSRSRLVKFYSRK